MDTLTTHITYHMFFLSFVPMTTNTLLGFASLKYYLMIYESPNSTEDRFISELSWPVRFLFDRHLSFSVRRFYGLDYIDSRDVEQSKSLQMASRIVWAIMSSIVPTLYIIGIGRATTIPEIASWTVGLIISLYFLYRSWYFGHKLKDMQGAADQPD